MGCEASLQRWDDILIITVSRNATPTVFQVWVTETEESRNLHVVFAHLVPHHRKPVVYYWLLVLLFVKLFTHRILVDPNRCRYLSSVSNVLKAEHRRQRLSLVGLVLRLFRLAYIPVSPFGCS